MSVVWMCQLLSGLSSLFGEREQKSFQQKQNRMGVGGGEIESESTQMHLNHRAVVYREDVRPSLRTRIS